MRGQVPRSCRGPISSPRRGCPRRALPQPGRAACAPVTGDAERGRRGGQPGRPHGGADDVGRQRAAADEPRHDDAPRPPTAASSSGAPEVTSGRHDLAGGDARGPVEARRAPAGPATPSSRLWPSSGSASSSHQAPQARERAARPGAARGAGQGREGAGEADEARAAARARAPTRRRGAAQQQRRQRRRRGRRPARRRRAATGRTSSRSASPAAASTQPAPGTSATRIAAPRPAADGGQRGVGQQAAPARARPAGRRRPRRRRARSRTAARRRPRAGAARPCRPRRRRRAAPRRARRRGRPGRRARRGPGAACGRAPRTAPAAGRRAWRAAAGWHRADAPQRRGRRARAHRVDAGQRLVEHEPERVEVAALVDALARRLLGRHVGERADDVAGAGQRLVAGQVGDAEVGQLGRAVGRARRARGPSRSAA